MRHQHMACQGGTWGTSPVKAHRSSPTIASLTHLYVSVVVAVVMGGRYLENTSGSRAAPPDRHRHQTCGHPRVTCVQKLSSGVQILRPGQRWTCVRPWVGGGGEGVRVQNHFRTPLPRNIGRFASGKKVSPGQFRPYRRVPSFRAIGQRNPLPVD